MDRFCGGRLFLPKCRFFGNFFPESFYFMLIEYLKVQCSVETVFKVIFHCSADVGAYS